MSIINQMLLSLIFIAMAHSKPLEVLNAIPETGPCHTSDWQVIMRGKWAPIEKCSKNCTCDPSGYLICGPWCEITYTECTLGEKMTHTTYYEEVGHTGCKRCSIKACDSIKMPETTKGYKETHTENKTQHLIGKYLVINETTTVYERPKSEAMTAQ